MHLPAIDDLFVVAKLDQKPKNGTDFVITVQR